MRYLFLIVANLITFSIFGQTIFQYDSKGNQIGINSTIDPCQTSQIESLVTSKSNQVLVEDTLLSNQVGLGFIDLKTSNKSDLKAFPNPSEDVINIEYSNRYVNKVEIIIYNLSGKLVRRLEVNPSDGETYRTRIDLSDLPSGVYQCVVVSEVGVESLKLVKS